MNQCISSPQTNNILLITIFAGVLSLFFVSQNYEITITRKKTYQDGEAKEDLKLANDEDPQVEKSEDTSSVSSFSASSSSSSSYEIYKDEYQEEDSTTRAKRISNPFTRSMSNSLSRKENRRLIEIVVKTMCHEQYGMVEKDPYSKHAQARGKLSESGQAVYSAIRLGSITEDIQKQDEGAVIGKKLTLKCVVKKSAFKKFMHRFANAQYNRTLCHPCLPQPKHELNSDQEGEQNKKSEMFVSRQSHRFIVTADTQFGVLMDGFAMSSPSWEQEIEYSQQCVEKINALDPKPLFVCVCGDLVDTEGSFSNAIASWKQIMRKWERSAIHRQQNQDFKQVWSDLNKDIALICLCGNHDVGNRPTPDSIDFFKSQFGDEYLAFWANGTYNICLNNCLFFDKSGAEKIYEEQLQWMEERLIYANENKATHIFIFAHFPWFLFKEDETKDDVQSASLPPLGWGSEGTAFADSYFHVPIESRKIALDLFKKYNVKACFCGHFHQNLTAKTAWGMDMIITGPLSLILKSTSKANDTEEEKKSGDEPDVCGMRIVDVNSKGGFHHKFVPLDGSSCN